MITHQDHQGLYSYDATPIGYGIGTLNLAFDMGSFYYPLQSIAGRGIKAGSAPSPVQANQVYIPYQAIPLAGLGGLQAGTIFSQPLTNPGDSTAAYY